MNITWLRTEDYLKLRHPIPWTQKFKFIPVHLWTHNLKFLEIPNLVHRKFLDEKMTNMFSTGEFMIHTWTVSLFDFLVDFTRFICFARTHNITPMALETLICTILYIGCQNIRENNECFLLYLILGF